MEQNIMHLCWEKATYDDQAFHLLALYCCDVVGILKMKPFSLSHGVWVILYDVNVASGSFSVWKITSPGMAYSRQGLFCFWY